MRQYKLILSLFFAFLLIGQQAFAQKKADSFFKEEEKKAKQGDVRAMVALGDAYRGDVFSSDDNRDFAKALKWYKKAQLSTVGTKGQKGELGLFLIHWIGGYGVERNEAEALRWLEEVKLQTTAFLSYDDRPNISLQRVAELQAAAEKGNSEAQVELARVYLEFGLEYPKAFFWLDRADIDGNNDAPFLKNKWQILRSRPNLLDPNNWQEYSAALTHTWQRGMAEGSVMATMEYMAAQMQTNRVEARTAEEVIKLTNSKKLSPELMAKAFLLIYSVKAGKEKYVYLRKFAEAAKGQDFSNSVQAQDANKAWANFSKKMASLNGYVDYASEHKEIRESTINLTDYRADYHGRLKGLIDLYTTLHKPENVAMIGAENIKNFDKDFFSKVFRVYQKVNTLDDLMNFRDMMNTENWLAPIREEYEARYPQKFAELGVSTDRIAYYQEKDRLNRKKFTNFAEGRLFLSELYLRNDLTASLKNELTSDTKKQIIYDIYGRSPSKKQLSQLQDVIYREKWILPEGEQVYFEMQHNSENNFSGDVTIGKVLYHYKCNRKGESNRFELNIYAVKNNQSNLVYNSSIDVQNKDVNTMVVKVFKSHFATYRWINSPSDYLEATINAQNPQFDTQDVGSMKDYLNKTQSTQSLPHKIKEAGKDFSQKIAVRSAVRYFILAYSNILVAP